MVSSFAQIVDLWPSLRVLADDAGVGYETTRQWRLRNSIPAKYWQQLVAAAKMRGIAGITLEMLADLAIRRAEAAE